MSRRPAGGPPPHDSPSAAERLFAALQAALPQHLLTRLVFKLMRLRWRPFKALSIAVFRRLYRVDLAEAAEPEPDSYPTFNAFFTRALAPGARPLAGGEDTVVSPVDGRLSRFGIADGGRLLQAKGSWYGLTDLLGGSVGRAAPFAGGAFATLYLAPSDYHRIHMPLAGRLVETVYVPGRLFAVNPATARALPNLFNRNERLAAIFDTPAGRMAVVLVGALFVAAIETVWEGLVTPPRGEAIRVRHYPGEPSAAGGPDTEPAIDLARGAEMGRFNMGSTVILLFEPGRVRWDGGLRPGAKARMGEGLGSVHSAVGSKLSVRDTQS